MRNSSLCALCIGSASLQGKECLPNNHERYYGYTGAFRCLVEKGDVAFVKSKTVRQNTGGRNTEDWAKNLKEEDFELLCPDGKRKPVTEDANCFLAKGPNHAVVSRKDKASCVRDTLLWQQVWTSQGLPFFPPEWVWMIWGSSVLSAAHTQAFPFWKLGSGGRGLWNWIS